MSESSPRLYKQEADVPHSMFAKLPWVGKRVRPDIEPALSFLCNRVAKNTVEVKAKLKRVLQLLKKTINDKRFMG